MKSELKYIRINATREYQVCRQSPTHLIGSGGIWTTLPGLLENKVCECDQMYYISLGNSWK